MIPQAIPRDSVARVVSDVLAAPAYDWHQGRSLTAWLRTVWRALLAWLERFAQDHPVGYVVFLLALTAVLIALLVHMGWVLHRALNPSQRAAHEAPRKEPIIRDAAWHLAEARRAADLGRFAEALAHRFHALVLELDRHRVVMAHPAKTPAEYAREARLPPERRVALEALVAMLYAHLYGGLPAGLSEWERFDGAAGSLTGVPHAAL